MNNAVRVLTQALVDIQSFDGGYERAWEIAEKALKDAGFNSGLHAKQILRQGEKPYDAERHSSMHSGV